MNPFAALIAPPVIRPGDRVLYVKPAAKPRPLTRAQKQIALADPWGLTACEAKALKAIVKGGSLLGAARLLGLSNKTVEEHSHKARLKMGVDTTLLAVLTWDRHYRAAA